MAVADAEREEKASRRRATAARSRRRRKNVARDFYGSALEAAEEIQGLDNEIALLRTKLRSVLSERPDDLPLMLRGIELLVKAVSARYRLSKEAEENLSESLAGVVRGVGGLLMPEAFADE